MLLLLVSQFRRRNVCSLLNLRSSSHVSVRQCDILPLSEYAPHRSMPETPTSYYKNKPPQPLQTAAKPKSLNSPIFGLDGGSDFNVCSKSSGQGHKYHRQKKVEDWRPWSKMMPSILLIPCTTLSLPFLLKISTHRYMMSLPINTTSIVFSTKPSDQGISGQRATLLSSQIVCCGLWWGERERTHLFTWLNMDLSLLLWLINESGLFQAALAAMMPAF